MNKVLNISHNPDELSVDEAISSFKDIDDGYVYSIPDIEFKTEDFRNFIADLQRKYPRMKEYDYTRTKNNVCKKYVHDDFKIYARGNAIDMFGGFYAKTEEMNNELWVIFNKHSKEEEKIQITSFNYFINNGRFESNQRMMRSEEMKYLSEKYYPYIDTELMFQQFFTGAENILLVVGAPGLGKSKLSTMAIKYAHDNPDILPYDKLSDNVPLDNQYISLGFVKSVDVLSLDQFWRELEIQKHDFVIIDDLDYMLTKRESEVQSKEDQVKNSFLNQFLSFTDGVEKNKTKFIITTNQKYDNIDAALLRRGRLFDILELRSLSKGEALEIWKDNNLSPAEFGEIFMQKDINPAELGSEINKRLNTRIANTTNSYLKETGISKVQKAGRSKKIKI